MAKRKGRQARRSEAATEVTIGVRAAAGLLAVVVVLVAAVWWVAGRGGAPGDGPAGVPAPGEEPGRTVEPGAASNRGGAGADSREIPAAAGDGEEPLGRPPAPEFEPGTWRTAEGDPAMGLAAAPVTIVAYTDFQCANCREFATEIVPWLRDTWLRRGFVRVIHRDFAVLGAESLRAAEAARCAGERGRFWSYYEALFERQSGQNMGAFSDEALAATAEAIGLDPTEFQACLESGRHREKVNASTQQGHSLGFEGTPTFVINGRTIAGAVSQDSWNELFEAYESDILSATQEAP